MLILNSPKIDNVIEEKGGKRGIIHYNSAQSLKIILTLLVKMVAIYVGLFLIGFQVLDFH